eukprot:GHRR01013798.1.p1 GENE.GHRR01013798.1~~GHRR01013798.1.p1  ORF type:complete len:601 (+),score=261.64 GHRR01013798.1:382-2184(+)
MQDPSTHRELVASVASLKSCIRSVVLVISPSAAGTANAGSKLQGSIERAADAAANLHRLLSAVADQTLSLPLETSRRLVDLGLPQSIQQLVVCCQPSSSWPDVQPDSTASVPALQHSSYTDVQQLVADVFQVLSLLSGVGIRACTRSTDPLMVLQQLVQPQIMAACTAYLQQLYEAQAADASKLQQGASVSHHIATILAAFSGLYSTMATGVDMQPGLQQLDRQLMGTLCSTGFVAAAVKLLLAAASSITSEEQQQPHQQDSTWQQIGWHLLTLALFLSGGSSITATSTKHYGAEAVAGQQLSSSALAAQIRQQGQHLKASVPTAGCALGSAGAVISSSIGALDSAAGTALPFTAVQQQLMAPSVLLFLEERLLHAAIDICGLNSSNFLKAAQPTALQAFSSAPVLPGQSVPEGQDAMLAALYALRCWRSLLEGPAAVELPVATPRGVQLFLAVLDGALAESIKPSSSEREGLRARVIRVAVHCLQLLLQQVSPGVLGQQLFLLTASLCRVVDAAGAYWSSHKQAVKSTDLPYTGQVRCVDKATGDMMVRYTMAAQEALILLQQLVHAGPVGEYTMPGALARSTYNMCTRSSSAQAALTS